MLSMHKTQKPELCSLRYPQDPGSCSCLVNAAVLEEVLDEHVGDGVTDGADAAGVGGTGEVDVHLLPERFTLGSTDRGDR